MFGRFHPPRRRAVRLARALLALSLLLGMLPVQTYAATDAPSACPASPSGLPDVIERSNFCVYYDEDDTSETDATTVADHTQAYWDLYTNDDFGFRDPLFTDKLVVEIQNDASCNGATGPGLNYFYINTGCIAASAESTQKVTGHELFHRVQYSYHGTEVKWFKEGTARAMEDLAFANIDNWPNALTASSSFNRQANQYLNNTNVDITSVPQRYNSALWWKYFTEQFGTITDEPQRGVDAMLALWEAAETQDDIAALNAALGALGTGMNFDAAFRRFTAANYIKDLTNQPHATYYNYIDEDEAGNPGAYGPIFPTNGGTINTGSAATFSNQAISRYGARYFRATPDAASCPVVSANFHTDSGPAFYHVITEKAGALESYETSTATDFSRSFFNDGLTQIVAIAGSTDGAAQVDVTLECITPDINIAMPNDGAVAHVGPFDGPGKILAQVQVHDGDPSGPVVAGLTVSDFKAQVNGVNALILTGGFIQQQYWLLIQAPNQTANGVYDLEITLEKSGTTEVVASDTNADSVAYNPDNIDHLLVIDRSGSMLSNDKMGAAREAAKFYVDITRINDGLAVIPYNQDVSPSPFDLRIVTASPDVRSNAKEYIDEITPNGLTSIGDGMREAVDQRNATPTGNPVCSYVLLSDGMENSPEFWSTVEDDAIATGCPVTAIAFGAASDETMMQQIATATGGIYFYNDVYTGASVAAANDISPQDTYLDLVNIYEYAQASSENRQRLLAEKGRLEYLPPASSVQTHTVMIDESMSEVLFALDWVPSSLSPALTLQMPDGTLITHGNQTPYTFWDGYAGHLGWRITNPMTGTWTLLVDFDFQLGMSTAEVNVPDQTQPETYYQVLVSGPSQLTLNQLLLPAVQLKPFYTGQRIPIYTMISTDSGPVPGLMPIAYVTAPDGTETAIPLFDDGQHGDGAPGDGFYAGLYTLVTQAIESPIDEKAPQLPTPKDEGSYQVRIKVQGNNFQRESLGSFSVLEGEDTNLDELPDPFEEEHGVSGGDDDPDLDDLDNLSEYQAGTDPNNSDTDGGGENDGSELLQGKDPFDPSDDEIVAPEFLVATPDIGLNVITYDVQPEYNRMVLYRATGPNGPWLLHVPELPATGVYSDTAENDTTYYYRYMGIDADDNRSAVIGTSPATPSLDPFPPEADVLIDKGAPTTPDLNVILNFVPYADEEEIERFEDIQEMKLSNDPQLTGAAWQPFTQDVPWTLAATPDGEIAKVYAQFRDDHGNESLITLGAIHVVVEDEPEEEDPEEEEPEEEDPGQDPSTLDLFLPSLHN